jgi:RNA ligase (TIGR02306 family)
MSTLLVQVCKINDIQKHPQADRLEVCLIKGWTVCTLIDSFKVGDLVVYIPPDSILTKELHEFLDITKYCAELPIDYLKPVQIQTGDYLVTKNFVDNYELQVLYGPDEVCYNTFKRPTARRVRATSLRGVSSYGVVLSLDKLKEFLNFMCECGTMYHNNTVDDLQEGDDVSQLLNIIKWEPPIKESSGDATRELPAFPKYTDIEQYGNYANRLQDGEEVVITEKIDGSNDRIGLVSTSDELGNKVFSYVAGSHNTNKREINKEGKRCLYWEPYTWYPQLKELLQELSNGINHAIVYGEIYGSGVANGLKSMNYGYVNGNKNFIVFDIKLNDNFLDWDDLESICRKYDIPTVPVIYRGHYYKNITELNNGQSLMPNTTHMREGCVIKPIHERIDPYLGRVILKSVSAQYLSKKEN